MIYLYINFMDFQKSSLEWRKNKKHLGNGFFKYKCTYKKCRKTAYYDEKMNIVSKYCIYHTKKLI